SALVREKGGGIVGLVACDGGSLAIEGRDVIARGSSVDLRVLLLNEPAEDVAAIPKDWAEPVFFDDARANLVRFWEGLVAKGAHLDVPDAKALATYRAGIVFQFIARDGAVLKPGEGFYDNFYLRDGALQLWSLELAGYLAEMGPSADVFLRYARPDGRLESQKGQLDANGQGLWALWARYAITGDRGWLERAWPVMEAAAAWIGPARRADVGPYPGVLPRALADGENLWDGSCHIVGYDVWNLRGLECARRAAEALGRTEEAHALALEYREYFAAFVDALDLQDSPGLPPSYEGRGTSWGNLEILHPTRILEDFDPRVTATLIRERGAFVEGTIRWSPQDRRAIHPYMSSFITIAEVIRGEQDLAVDHFFHFLAHTTAMQGFPEGVYYDRRIGWGDTIPHQWAAAMYMILLRNMLLREEERTIHLLSAVPPAWLAPGKTVALRRAPTTLGGAGFEIRTSGDGATLTVRVDGPSRSLLPPPRGIRVHLPPAYRGIDATPRRIRDDASRIRFSGDNTLLLPPRSGTWRIRWEVSPKATFRTFEDYARQYAKARERALRPVAGVLPGPFEVSRERAVSIDLAPFAVTDPRTMPFGVDTGGKLVFDGLPAGEAVAAGVPFRLIDPAANDGKGLIVLAGEGAGRRFPRAVDIPAGVAGARIFFLGQVGGWAVSDPPGTLAGRYVIRYADGEEDAIPLVVGATLDDWLQEPDAGQVEIGLTGGGWHLYVLGAPLREAAVRSIRFEDAGTPSAPVLAAITIEAR
ncbi:MAG: hypothetical protein JXP34_15960, partial [Planctomycetes bacterium]|nr:hypothetical protein [Planctomycetota bacterium]